MRRLVVLLTVTLFNTINYGQQTTDKKRITATITSFFEGLHKRDSLIVANTLHPSVHIQTIFTSKEGKPTLRNKTRMDVLRMIHSKKATDIYDEKLLNFDMKIDGNLASVWTPYEFYFNKTFSHCGTNSFQLFNDNGHWKIIYLVDTRRRRNCTTQNEKK